MHLREVHDSDVSVFFDQMQDRDAQWMAAFVSEDPSDRDAHMAHWARIRAAEAIIIRTVVVDDAVAGHVASWMDGERREVTYWIGREHWGRGVATEALSGYLGLVAERPIQAHVAKDNAGSIRVLEKCGFHVTHEERGYAHARGAEIDELVLLLD